MSYSALRFHLLVTAALLWLPTAAVSQVQTNQAFISQGPSPSVGPIDTVQSADAPPNGSVAGAIGPIIVDPQNTNRYFVGTPGGGIWVTDNGGTTWTPLTDNQASLSIASLDFDPTDPDRNTLIAGTGLTANGSVCTIGACFFTGSGGLRNGLLYSQDGGTTWNALGTTTLGGQTVDAVAARGDVILAGTFEISGLVNADQQRVGGLYRSTDGGATFSLVSGTHGLPLGPVTSIVGDPTNTNILYAAVSTPAASANANTALFISTDKGATWTQVFGAAQSNGTIQAGSQTALKVASGPDGALAVGVVDLATSKVTGLFWSGNSGNSWTTLQVPTLNNGGQAPVNFAIALDPKNTNLVYVTGDRINPSPFTVTAFRIDALNSPDTATSITNESTANGSTVHADSRAMAFDANGRLLLTTDGTLYVRTMPENDAGVWTRLSGNISAFEPYAVAYDAIGKRLMAASQDTGVAIQSARNSPMWNAIQGGDGINAFINDVTLAGERQTAFYSSSQEFGSMARVILDAMGNFLSPNTAVFGFGAAVTCNGGDCSELAGTSFSSPWVQNRKDPTRMALGASHVYVTQDTLTGAQDPSATTVDLTLTDLGSTMAGVTKIAYGTRDNSNMLVAGAADKTLWQSTTAATGSLTAVTAYNGLAPTGIVLDPRSQNRYFVADNTDLFGTTNQGASFGKLTANLPATIIRPTALEFISNNGVDALLIGGLNNEANAQSPVAVADSDTLGALSNWRPFGTGLPNSQVSALSYNAAVDVLAVGTFGRGVYALYDVTSYFSQATVLQFGLADNDSNPDASFLTNGTVGNRPLVKYGSGTLTIDGAASYSGDTTINGGTLQLGTGGASGSILGNVVFCSDASVKHCDASDDKVLAFNRSDSYTFAGTISGAGQVRQNGSGNTILTGASSYSGSTFVNAGFLTVNGSIDSSVFVNYGATLGGHGAVGNTTLHAGGMLSPGDFVGTMSVNGNLVFNVGSLYLVEVAPTANDRTDITGTATLNGTVLAIVGGNSYQKAYTILHADGGLGGTTFSDLAASGVPGGFSTSLSYDATNVYLDLMAALGLSGNLAGNPQNVANSINTYFNNGGALPPNFLPLFSLTGTNLSTALNLLSGEAATGAQYGAFQFGNQFLSMMLDPFVHGRSGGLGGGMVGPGGALALTAEPSALPPEIALAYAKVLKAPPAPAYVLPDRRFSVWAGGFGGANRTQGDLSGAGSHDITTRTGGYAAGMDYRMTPDTVLGFALGGGFTNWGLADGLGSGKSDAFQAGLYGVTRSGAAYLAGAANFTEYWMKTNRTAYHYSCIFY